MPTIGRRTREIDVPAVVIAEHGGWKPTSPTVHGYMRTANQWKNNAMRGTGF
jgi:hypothetical protein